jgi:hypothetical protein
VADLTELVDIDPERVDLVKNPASGFPILLMKAVSETAPEPTPATPVAPATDATKETIVPEATPQDPQTPAAVEPPASEPVEKTLAELVQEEVAKAVQPLSERNKALEDEMAALKSLPIPGGPVVTVPGAQRDRSEKAHLAAEAARFRHLAKSVSDDDLVRFYEMKADEAEKASRA